jgi:hypothetical protein
MEQGREHGITSSIITTTSCVASLTPSKYSSSASRPRLQPRKFSFTSDRASVLDSKSSQYDRPSATSVRTRSASSLGARHRTLSSAATPTSPPTSQTEDVRPDSSSSSLCQTLSAIPSPHDLSPAASYFALRSNPSGSELRSPHYKRPPASRSSHGIETSTGPPPALSTQRTCSIETWRLVRADQAALPLLPVLTPRSLTRLDATSTGAQSGNVVVEGAHNFLREEECVEIHDPDLIPSTQVKSENPSMTTAAASSRFSGSAASKRQHTSSFSTSQHARHASHSSNEDLFFDLANGDDVTETPTQAHNVSWLGSQRPNRANQQSSPEQFSPHTVMYGHSPMPLVTHRKRTMITRSNRRRSREVGLGAYKIMAPVSMSQRRRLLTG